MHPAMLPFTSITVPTFLPDIETLSTLINYHMKHAFTKIKIHVFYEKKPKDSYNTVALLLSLDKIIV
jgi:hypothetical protein